MIERLNLKHDPEILQIYNDLDPTRVAYSDGSTSLWDELDQPLISRHYDLECTGEDFLDKSKPLHVGELGKFHYGQPIDNLVWGNDSIFGSYEKCAIDVAQEAADIMLQARSAEVASLFPWNISSLDNYRPSSKEMEHHQRLYKKDFTIRISYQDLLRKCLTRCIGQNYLRKQVPDMLCLYLYQNKLSSYHQLLRQIIPASMPGYTKFRGS